MTRHLPIAFFAVSLAFAAPLRHGVVPLFFVENHGRAPSAVRFMAQGSGLTAYFEREAALFRMEDRTVRLEFIGAEPSVHIEGVGPLAAKANFLLGPEEDWRVGVPLYRGIAYRNLYPGIDMLYGGAGRNLKSEFVVAPGADPRRIRLRYTGARNLSIDETGALIISFGGRDLRENAPVLYQQRRGAHIAVEGRFSLASDGTVSFIVSDYDRSAPLIIDPTLSYSTLLGGSNSDSAMSLAVDSSGAAYIAGFTASSDFPTGNPEQNFNAGGNDVFIAKLDPSGAGLVYCTYIGGKADDRAYGIAVDSTGAAYVAGSTTSSNFPVRNPLQATIGGGKDAFVLKLNPAGNTLVFSTYLGGSASDIANDIAVDATGVYIAGDTTSINFTATAYQKGIRGAQDAFVVKLSTDGTRRIYSTYLGGSGDDHGAAIALDASGDAYITGSTWSTDFPVAAASQSRLAGGQDAFVTKVSADGNSLLFSTFLGGTGGTVGYPEAGQGIAVDAQGNAYIAGVTSSADFPLLQALQSTKLGGTDAFVSKLSSAGSLVYSTYLGGTGIDAANAIAVDSTGSAYVAGQTFSSDLPVVNSLQATYAGDYDAFWAKLDPTGSTLSILSYLGGNGSDTATAIALDGSGGLYLAGWTMSTNFPVQNGYQSGNPGNYGAFVTRIAFGTVLTAVGVSPNSGTGSSQTFTFQFSDSSGASDLTTVSALINSSSSTANACSVTYNQAANSLALLTDSGTAPSGSITPGSGSQQNSQCVLNGSGSSASLSGNVLTLNLSLTFQAAFSGTKTIYLQAANASGSSGWQQGGSWTIPASGPPAAVSVSPSSGTGMSQTFTFVYTDPGGYAAIKSASIIVHNILSGTGACYISYRPPTGLLYLANDAATAWLTPAAPGSSTGLQNSECTIDTLNSSVSGSGNTLTLTLNLTFQSALSGARNVYMDVNDATADSGWQQRGTWTVATAAPPPTTVSVTPGSGSGTSQTFTFVYSDPSGYASITAAQAIINNALVTTAACYVSYRPGSNLIYLATDAGNAWLSPVTIGTTGSLQNSQCTVDASKSSASGSGNTLTVNLAITFQSTFTGARNVYMEVYDNSGDSGWLQRGTWTVPSGSAGAPAAVSVSPSSGNGTSQTFTFVFSDPNGYAALSGAQVLINNTLSASSGCYLLYSPATRALYLGNDAGSGWLPAMTPGTGTVVQNSQCSVDPAKSSATGSGNNLTLTVALTFQSTFTGARNIYMDAYDSAGDSGWQQRGTWTIPTSGAPTAVSVTPSSGSGSTQTFTFVFSDPNGYTAIRTAQMIVNSSLNGSWGCYLIYTRSTNTLNLTNDAATAWQTAVTVGQTGTLQNNQCIVNSASSSVSGSGNLLTLNVSLTFKPGFTGNKNIYMEVYDGTADSGWQQRGTWTTP